MEMVRLGIIGIGNMGSAHAANVNAGKISGMTLAAICDIDQRKLDWARENLNSDVRLFSDYRELLLSGCVDAVVIATPHYLHPDIAVSAFEAGLHVLSEKPAGVYTAQVERMNEVAKKSGKVFGIMFNQRTNPLFAKARELVQTGELGEPKRFVWIITNWYRTQFYYDSGTWRASWNGEGGGVLINQCPHNLDLWQWIFGMPARINGFCAYGKYHNIEVEDDVTAYAEYDNGATAVFITTTGEYPGTNRVEISGDKAKLVIENGTLKMWKLDKPEREICFTAQDSSIRTPPAFTEIVAENGGEGHNGILQNFTDAILKGTPLLSPGYDGINALTISNAIHLSDWTKSQVSLPIDKELFEKLLREKSEAADKKAEFTSKVGDLHGVLSNRWNVNW